MLSHWSKPTDFAHTKLWIIFVPFCLIYFTPHCYTWGISRQKSPFYKKLPVNLLLCCYLLIFYLVSLSVFFQSAQVLIDRRHHWSEHLQQFEWKLLELSTIFPHSKAEMHELRSVRSTIYQNAACANWKPICWRLNPIFDDNIAQWEINKQFLKIKKKN